MTFLDGEWTSDSLNIPDKKIWKEFIYFDHGKILANTTWWGKNYVLNENAEIIESKFKDSQNNIFIIKVLDSNKIEIKGANYFAQFKKEKDQPSDIKSEISSFKKSQKNREKLIGRWHIQSVSKNFTRKEDQENSAMQEIIRNSDFDKFLIFNTNDIAFIELNLSNLLIYLKNKRTIKLDYIVNNDGIEVLSGDVIYKIPYIINHGKWICKNYNTIGIISEINFVK